VVFYQKYESWWFFDNLATIVVDFCNYLLTDRFCSMGYNDELKLLQVSQMKATRTIRAAVQPQMKQVFHVGVYQVYFTREMKKVMPLEDVC
jgi:hypothetical protein